jgi:hypothetical protein
LNNKGGSIKLKWYFNLMKMARPTDTSDYHKFLSYLVRLAKTCVLAYDVNFKCGRPEKGTPFLFFDFQILRLYLFFFVFAWPSSILFSPVSLLELFQPCKLVMYPYHYAPALMVVFAAYARGDIIGDALNNVDAAFDPSAGKCLPRNPYLLPSAASQTHIHIRGFHDH